MKTNILKILTIATLMIFVGTGVSLADGWKGNGGRGGYAHGHYRHEGYPHYRYCAPKPLPVVRYYRPVVVRPYVYYPPVVYAAPVPNGYFYGPPTVIRPGVAFSFGMSGH